MGPRIASQPLSPAGSRAGVLAGRALGHALLLAVGALMVFPFLWTVGTSLKLSGEIFTWPPSLYPAHPRPANYLDLFRTVPFFSWLANSVIITALATAGRC